MRVTMLRLDEEREYELYRTLNVLMDREDECIAEGNREGAAILDHVIEHIDAQIGAR